MPEGAIIIGDKCKFEFEGELFEGEIGWEKNDKFIQLGCIYKR